MPSSGVDLIRQSIARMEKQLWEERERTYTELENFYIGGQNVRPYLVKFPAEEWSEYQDRLDRLEYPNYVARVADALIDGVYGDAVMRSLDADSERYVAQQEVLDAILTRNAMRRKQRQIGYGFVVLGDGWVNIAARDTAAGPMVAIMPAHPANIRHEVSDDDPSVIVSLTERRVSWRKATDGKLEKRYSYWGWTLDEWVHIGFDGQVEDEGENVYGRIPYVKWPGRPVLGEVDGLSYVRDQVTTQKALLNKLSEMDVLTREQAHGTMVISDYDDVKTESGPTRAIKVGANGSAAFIQPGAEIESLRNVIQDYIARMCETGNIPLSLLRGGTASSGLQLAIEMRPFTRTVETMRSDCTVSEIEMVRTICAVGRAHEMNLPDPEEISPRIDWSDNVLPSDKQAEFTMDMAMVSAFSPLMTRRDFVRKWHDGIETDDDAEKYLIELESEDRPKPAPVVIEAPAPADDETDQTDDEEEPPQ